MYVQPDRPQNDLDAGCYRALDWNFNFLSCVVAQPVDWLPLAAMGLSVFRGEAPIQFAPRKRFVMGLNFRGGANPINKMGHVAMNSANRVAYHVTISLEINSWHRLPLSSAIPSG